MRLFNPAAETLHPRSVADWVQTNQQKAQATQGFGIELSLRLLKFHKLGCLLFYKLCFPALQTLELL
jgi:hypothetical protein